MQVIVEFNKLMLLLLLTELVSCWNRSQILKGSELAKKSGSLATKLSTAMDADVGIGAGTCEVAATKSSTAMTVCESTGCGLGGDSVVEKSGRNDRRGILVDGVLEDD